MGRRVCEWVFVREGRCGQERGCCGVKVGRVVVVGVEGNAGKGGGGVPWAAPGGGLGGGKGMGV